jgi:hypothetical protein
LLARLQAETAGFHARITAAAATVDRMGNNSRMAARATMQLRGSLQGLATEAFGLTGRAGQAANALLSLTGGLGALAAVAAAGGVAALILKEADSLAKLTEQADAAAAAARRLAAARLGSPFLQRLANTEDLLRARDKTRAEILERVHDLQFDQTVMRGLSIPKLAEFDTRLAEMLRLMRAFNAQLVETVRQPEAILVDMRHQLALIGLPIREAATLQAQWRGLIGKSAEAYIDLAVNIDEATRSLKAAAEAQADFLEGLRVGAQFPSSLMFRPGVVRAPRGISFPGFNAPPTVSPHFLPRDPFAGVAKVFGVGPQFPRAPQAAGFRMTPELAQMLLMSAMMMGRGGVGGALGGLGGLTTALSGMTGIVGKAAAGPLGWAGFGLSAIGGIFSLFDKSEDRRQREMMEELRRIRENTDRRGRPDLTSVSIFLNGREISGALAEDVLYQIRRLERRDAVPRLPPR